MKKELCFAERICKNVLSKWLFIITGGLIHSFGLLFGLTAFKLVWSGLPIKLVLVISFLGGIVFAHALYNIIGRHK